MTGCDWKVMSHLILIDLWMSSEQVDLIEFAQGSLKSQSKNGITLLLVGNLDLGSLWITSGENIWFALNRCSLGDVKKLAHGCGPLNQG